MIHYLYCIMLCSSGSGRYMISIAIWVFDYPSYLIFIFAFPCMTFFNFANATTEYFPLLLVFFFFKCNWYLIEWMRFSSKDKPLRQIITIRQRIVLSQKNKVVGDVMLEGLYMHYRVEDTIFLRLEMMLCSYISELIHKY